MGISLKSVWCASLAHQLIQLILGNMPKWRVAQVVRKPRSFRGVTIDSPEIFHFFRELAVEMFCDSPGDLRNLQRVREPVVEDVTPLR